MASELDELIERLRNPPLADRINTISLHTEAAETLTSLRGALEWYEEQARGCRKIGYAGDLFRRALDADGGERARKALSSIRGE